MTPAPDDVAFVSNGILLIMFSLIAMFAISAPWDWK
jgi:hypothetical protein